MSEKYALYNEFKESLKASIEITRVSAIAKSSAFRPDYLFGIEDSQDQLYSNTIKALERQILLEVENLVQKLCSKYDIACDLHNQGKSAYDMVIESAGKTYKVVFKTSPKTYNAATLARIEPDPDMTMVYLLKQTQESEQVILQPNRSLPWGRVFLFAGFINEIFGAREAKNFNNSMEHFSEEIREIIGYQVTEICTGRNLEKLRKDLDKDIRDFDYNAYFTEATWVDYYGVYRSRDLNQDFFNIILQKFTTKTYKILLGDSNYARSFQTSEWLFRKFRTHPDLDNTFMVAGYFKSVEQLLWSIILLKELEIKIENDNHEIGTSEIDALDMALGSMISILNSLDDTVLLLPAFSQSSHFVKKYIIAKLNIWRDECRNSHFHKDNIQDVDTLSDMRGKTYFVLLLILGAFNLSDDDISNLIG